jgi:hypothetical protein
MGIRKVVTVVFLGVVLSVLVGWAPTVEMKLNLVPKSETVYKVVTGSAKDYQFVQPSINKTKERHTSGNVEMVFSQKVESVDQQGNATVNITIKQLKYLSKGPEGVKEDFDSQRERDKSNPLAKLVGASYKIKISPRGGIEVLDASAARSILKGDDLAGTVAAKLFSNEEMARRHQIMALFDAGKCLCEKDRQREAKAASNKKTNSKDSKNVRNKSCKKGYKWSALAASPQGTLSPKTFEKVYTLTNVKEKDGQKIATVEMNAVPSSKRLDDPKKEQAMNLFSSMFDEKNSYTGKMVINLTTGVIDSYQETYKSEWLAAESGEEQKSDQGPDQLMMGFTQVYSIEKVN